MQEWEEKALERQEAREEGRKEGRRFGFQEGRKAGVQEGADEQKKAIAKKLLNKGMEIETIVEVTGLSEEAVTQLE